MLAQATRDRFHFALFVAISVHAAIILGVGFSSDLNMPTTTSIEVTISVANDQTLDEKADFLANSNQKGSGDADEPRELTTTERSEFHSNQNNKVFSQRNEQVLEQQSSDVLVSTTAETLDQTATEDLTIQEEVVNPLPDQLDRDQLIQEIASLEARIAADQQALSNRPRTRHLNQMSTRSAAEASYVNAWREKCERIGRINYPPGRLEGEVLMLVSILADGTLEHVKVLRSSGHRALDQAALATVRQAAPFQPFSVEMSKQYDRLEFTRFWQFSRS